DENGDAGVGDRVSLMETRPLSATKRWRLVEILEKAK
ncbi:30S ribosomal protein S17, partial [Mycolicibacterium elephantis]